MGRSRNANAFVRDDIRLFGVVDKASAEIGAQIHLMMSIGDGESLGEFTRPGAEVSVLVYATASPHQVNAAPRFQGAN
jgi:hypothetical protein